MQHTKLKAGNDIAQSAVIAAGEVAAAGGSPRAQIDAARQASGTRLVYKPHIGARQKARALARMSVEG